MALNLRASKSIVMPTPEAIKDTEVRGVFKKLMSSNEDDRIRIYEDLKSLYNILAGIDSMQNTFKSQDVIPKTDDTYYLGEIGSPFKAYKGIILKDTTDGKHYKILCESGALTVTALD